MRRLRALIAGAIGAACTAVGVSACDVPAPTQMTVEPGLVVFSVLDPAAAEQTVLLMQTRPAVRDTTSRAVSIDDPIVSAGETPVSNARVVVYAANGDSAVAIEDRTRRTDRLGAGVYRFWSSGNASTLPAGAFLRVEMGAHYSLRVTSSVGNAAGTTQVPFNDRVLSVAARSITRSRDTVQMGESVVRAAGFVYTLRNAGGNNAVQGSPQYRRSVERRLMLPSGNDWAFAFARERFITGSRHLLTVMAADSSFYGYYSSDGDPFADRSANTSLRGAVGVFGSIVLMYSSIVTVAAQ